MDFEKIMVSLNRDENKEKEYEVPIFYRREARMETNEEGMYRRLTRDLEKIG
jgi:hypothetical protein